MADVPTRGVVFARARRRRSTGKPTKLMTGNGSRSRTGCADCRRRKRRCDEGKPECGSCRRHRVACVYVRPDQNSPPKFLVSVAGNHFIAPLEAAASDSFVDIRSDEIASVCQQYAENAENARPTPQDRPRVLLVPNPSWSPFADGKSGPLETRFVQYYFEVISNSKVYLDTDKNIFRAGVMPVLLSRHGPLLSTVLALSAAEWGRRDLRDGVDYTATALRYKVKALTQLQSRLDAVADAEENLLTCVLQASLEIAQGSQPSWLEHLRGALAIMHAHGGWISPDSAALVLQYFRFRYVLMKTTEHAAATGGSDDCDAAIRALDRFLPSRQTWQTIDPQIGCSMELVEIISMTTSARQHGASLDARIRQLKFRTTAADDEYILKSAECFRFAALIYLQLIVFDAPIRYPSTSTMLQPLIDCLTEVVVADERRRSFPMWPLFIAGCVSCTDGHRKTVLDLFNHVNRKWPISNISTVMKVVWTIWQTRDFDNGLVPTSQHDWQNIISKFGWKLSLS